MSIARPRPVLALCAVVLGSCAAQPDHFYALSTMPAGARAPAAGFASHVILSVSIPEVVDRRQMIIDAPGDQILVLEHERWAAPLSDLVAQTLARDIEQRRADVLVAGAAFDQPEMTPVRIKVDIVRMTAEKAGKAVLEAHWRIVDPLSKSDSIGGETFTAQVNGEDYSAVARAFSACVASLAQRLSEGLAGRLAGGAPQG